MAPRTRGRDWNGTMNRVDDRWFLPLEGLMSGVLTCLTLALPFGLGRAVFLFVGFVFGAVVSAHFWLFRGVRSAFGVIGFIATCTVAYTVSVFATMWTPFRLQILNFSGSGSGAVDSSPFLIGGFLGAAILCAGMHFFLAPSKNWPKFLLKAVCISVACGFLGVLGWAAGEQLSNARWLPTDQEAYALYIIWQTGAAALLGLLLSPQETLAVAPVGVRPASVPLQTKTGRTMPSVAAIIFLVLVVATLAWFITQQVYRERVGRRWAAAQRAAQQAAQQRLAAARPSSQDLPAIVELPIEQVLILKPIAGHPCSSHFQWKLPGNSDFVPYTAQYKRSETAGDAEVSFASVDVRLYPNSDWAVYATKKGIMWNLEAQNPSAVTTVTKFGYKVIMNTLWRFPNGDGDLYFYWASGNKFLQVTFHGPEEDEFLNEYLALYPSSL
jgi:hypothetical protein